MLKIDPKLPARRRCIHCREFFNSVSAAHRVCPGCRRSHNKRLANYGYVEILPISGLMSTHIAFQEEEIFQPPDDDSTEWFIDRLLDGDSTVEDTIIYTQLEETTDEPFI